MSDIYWVQFGKILFIVVTLFLQLSCVIFSPIYTSDISTLSQNVLQTKCFTNMTKNDYKINFIYQI